MSDRKVTKHPCFECGRTFELYRMVRCTVVHNGTKNELEFLFCVDCAWTVSGWAPEKEWADRVSIWFHAP